MWLKSVSRAIIWHQHFSTMSLQNSAVKQAIYEELQNILSSDTNVRTCAEERLSQLKFTEGKTILTFLFTGHHAICFGMMPLQLAR